GVFYRTDYLKPKKITSITDGTSNTMMIGEDIPSINNHCAWSFFNYATATAAIPLNNNKNPATGAPYAIYDWGNVYSFRSKHTNGPHSRLRGRPRRLHHRSARPGCPPPPRPRGGRRARRPP